MNPSRTAAGVATLRAAHQLIDGAPRILDDPIAARLLDADALERIRTAPDTLQTAGARALRAHVLMRSRYAEDRLAAAFERGVRQYVILGAGFDTFAYRQPPWAAAMRVFEVDQPATQGEKRRAVEHAQVHVPSNVVYVSVNFETQTLRERLAASGFDAVSPAFFSWLGVTMYLDEDAIDAVLRFVASLVPGSEIVLTFAPKQDASEPRRRIAERAAEVGEPWKTHFSAAAMAQKLERTGFSTVVMPTADELDARYFRGRADGLPGPRRQNIVSAIV